MSTVLSTEIYLKYPEFPLERQDRDPYFRTEVESSLDGRRVLGYTTVEEILDFSSLHFSGKSDL